MKNPSSTPKSIFITGASSGIGQALAIEYATTGINLFLCGRNQKRLEKTAMLCKKKGAIVQLYTFDVINASDVQKALTKADNICPLDLVIANAGISNGILGLSDNTDSTRNIMGTNILGVINTILPAINLLKKHQKGQLALMSSMAGYRGLANCPAYSASKNCVKAWGEALRGVLKKENIQVSIICPGFIRTPLTDANTFKMPFLMDVDKAAQIIKKGLKNNKRIIAFPKIMALGAWIGMILPGWLIEPILNLLPQKEK